MFADRLDFGGCVVRPAGFEGEEFRGCHAPMFLAGSDIRQPRAFVG